MLLSYLVCCLLLVIVDQTCAYEIRSEAFLSVFFFQAEDGIRDLIVTGVQTCALPIYPKDPWSLSSNDVKSSGEDKTGRFWVANSEGLDEFDRKEGKVTLHIPLREPLRSEERRVGKECRSRWSPYH